MHLGSAGSLCAVTVPGAQLQPGAFASGTRTTSPARPGMPLPLTVSGNTPFYAISYILCYQHIQPRPSRILLPLCRSSDRPIPSMLFFSTATGRDFRHGAGPVPAAQSLVADLHHSPYPLHCGSHGHPRHSIPAPAHPSGTNLPSPSPGCCHSSKRPYRLLPAQAVLICQQ